MQRELTAEALTSDEVARLMKDGAGPVHGSPIALAVSGGPDSMAMSFVLHRWTMQNGVPPPMAFIVDHGLRPESATEARDVKTRLEKMGVPTEILRWEHAPITSRLHSEARKARYRLLLEACKRHGFSMLLFAHQREDQAETILMRFSKGTGLDGLAGIPAHKFMNGVRIFRPFLAVSKERLIATCVAENIPFVSDPSNGLQKFARGRMRRVLPLLADEGLTIERLLDFGTRAAEARDALGHYTIDFLSRASRQDEFGTIAIDKPELLAVPRAIVLRSLALALQAVHTEDYAPLHASLSSVLDGLQANAVMPARTLHGCLVSQSRERILIAREYSGITESIGIDAGESALWDGRWQVTLGPQAESARYTLKALGNPAHETLDRLAPGLRHQVPRGRVRATLPALWLGNEIAIIPFLNQNVIGLARLLPVWPPQVRN